MMNNNDENTRELQFPPISTAQEIFCNNFGAGAVKYHQQNPRKKRSKLMRIEDNPVATTTTTSSSSSKPKYGKKPDPGAPKITRPCTECGKKFWSWKALFGHMRCHPERQWRGINPPPNFRRPRPDHCFVEAGSGISVDDHEVASCLLMLANGASPSETLTSPTTTTVTVTTHEGLLESQYSINGGGGGGDTTDGAGPSQGVNCRFECLSCKKVFGSHQALGGHRASHKNVKGCFAINRSDGTTTEELNQTSGHFDHRIGEEGDVKEKMFMVLGGHKCSICLRVFSSGQALGGHKRCHWEKMDEPSSITLGLNPFGDIREGCGLDLNLPAPTEDNDDDDDDSSSYSSGLVLDLRLGL